MVTSSVSSKQSPRQIILDAIHHLDHVLPAQAPIHDFVHHNTLHGFQHLPFEEALAAFTELTGIDCYLPEAEFRAFYEQGRITDTDLDAALTGMFGQTPLQTVTAFHGRTIERSELYRLALLHDLTPITPVHFDWQLREEGLLDDAYARELWHALLAKLELKMPDLHPEDLLDLSAEQAEQWLQREQDTGIELQMQNEALNELSRLFDQVGDSLSLRGLLNILTGKDVLNEVRPQLIRLCASLLDEGLAAWRLARNPEQSLYRIWRQNLDYDIQPFFHELGDWQSVLQALPEDAIDAIVQQLEAFAIPQTRWEGYLQRLALELPGWSGLINWRQTHPAYQTEGTAQPLLADYLAIRLILDRLNLRPLCRKLWHCEARFDKLQAYFQKNWAEFAVRQATFAGHLPEYLVQAVHALPADNSGNKQAWHTLAERVWTWRQSPLAGKSGHASVYDQGWRLFQICRQLAITPAQLEGLAQTELLGWLEIVDTLSATQRNQVWLSAYEHHYRQDLLRALLANHGRGRWAKRERRPEAQIIFCMDDREEGIRRHLEELNPAVETLGAAGFFGVPMNYRGLDDDKPTPLCPVVVVPAHNVDECCLPGQDGVMARHSRGMEFRRRVADWLHHGLRRNALLAYPLINVAAPIALLGLLAKSFFPKFQHKALSAFAASATPEPATRLAITALDNDSAATPEQPRDGFTDQEQADRVAGFLRNTGLTYGFAELVVLMGHGSMSQNNPHLAAYDCGACSGRHGGPNARLFAAMANRREVRQLLAERGIAIPEDTWFIGAEHNTCDEDMTWYDLADLPPQRQAALDKFIGELGHAQRMSAHERCRRLASAPRQPSPAQALRHFLGRAADFSQARPELGHATNAAALVGRRSLTQGAFFDRRLFLISYDPSQDPDGKVLEGILLAVGPVGAGINLEYYFSTVNNERLGCGSKVPHNLTGFFAVMEGAGSDLRTGLPRQMIEIHEAMRLQLIVEAKTSVLEQIYGRQESLRELIGGGWVHLIAKDPDSGEIFIFQRGAGFVPWQAETGEPPLRENSPDCYRSETQPVAPMLIRQPDFAGAR